VTFDRAADGILKPGEAEEAPNARVAVRRAEELADTHAGVAAFARTDNPVTRTFDDAEVLAVFGDVNLDALRR
jgi:hypothetical protein